MTKRLRDLDVAEVSLVPKGANRKKFLLLKEEEVSNMPDTQEILQAVLETELDNEADVEEALRAASLSEQAASAIKGALRLLEAYKDELPKDIMQTLAGLAGYGYPAPAQKTEKEDDKMSNPIIKADGSIDFEAVSEEVRPAIEMLWKENQEAVKKAAELEKILKEEHDRQATREYIAKASEFKGLPVKPEEFGPVLKSLAEAAPEAYAKLDEVLKAADEAAIQARLLEELGASGPSPSSAMGKIDAMAEALVEKDSNMTHEQAVDKVLAKHPELYTEYQAESKARR